ncbi:MAG: SIS domain-containing protein [Gammaproteobacteria bacterium]|nr:SIS domain-containing protein [Gammaproteobacteria bacterium]
MRELIQTNLDEHKKVICDFISDDVIQEIEAVSKELCNRLFNSNTILWCGNGGSAADSQHLSAELVGRFKVEREPLRSIALTTDTSALTCIGNDYSFEDVFARQVLALARPGDVLMCISTSGNSQNVINAVEAAKKNDIFVVGLLGGNGGALRQLCDRSLIVPSGNTARIQEVHILIGHILCDLIDKAYLQA